MHWKIVERRLVTTGPFDAVRVDVLSLPTRYRCIYSCRPITDIPSRVLDCFGRFDVRRFQQVAITVDHFYGPPAMPIHHFADARSTL